MKHNASRILTETMLSMAFKQIKAAPERTTRNLIDMALHFSRGRFQRHFFKLAQAQLQNRSSPYYDQIVDIIYHVEHEKLLCFGMNMGYNGCTVGAETIRRLEELHGFNIPWTVTLCMPEHLTQNQADRYRNIFDQGERMGIHTWMLSACKKPLELLTFAEEYPNSAFVVLCAPKEIDTAFLEQANHLDNLMIALQLDEDTEDCCQLLREYELLYSVFYVYNDKNAGAITNGDLFLETTPMHPIFTAVIPSEDCSAKTRENVYNVIRFLRMNNPPGSMSFDLVGDCNSIDSIISDDCCFAAFDEDGTLMSGRTHTGLNLMTTELMTVFRQAFPKRQESTAL